MCLREKRHHFKFDFLMHLKLMLINMLACWVPTEEERGICICIETSKLSPGSNTYSSHRNSLETTLSKMGLTSARLIRRTSRRFKKEPDGRSRKDLLRCMTNICSNFWRQICNVSWWFVNRAFKDIKKHDRCYFNSSCRSYDRIEWGEAYMVCLCSWWLWWLHPWRSQRCLPRYWDWNFAA